MKNWLFLIVLFLFSCETEYIDGFDTISEDPIEVEIIPPPTFPTNGLIAYYPFNGNTLDESGNENHPIEDTSILSVDRNGEENASVYFSGEKSVNYIKLDINTYAITETKAYTLSLWVYREGSGYTEPRVLEFWGNDGPGQLGFTWPNGELPSIGNIYDSGDASITEFNVSSNNWHHIVYTVDEDKTKLYINNELIEEKNALGTPSLVGKVAFGMMNHPLWDSFNGKLDDIGIWYRVLDEEEITYLFEN
jgi:hypothetical protein